MREIALPTVQGLSDEACELLGSPSQIQHSPDGGISFL